jgi:hypothetical protein
MCTVWHSSTACADDWSVSPCIVVASLMLEHSEVGQLRLSHLQLVRLITRESHNHVAFMVPYGHSF